MILQLMRRENVGDILGIGEKRLRAEHRPLRHAAGQRLLNGGVTLDADDLLSVLKVRSEPVTSFVFDAKPLMQNVHHNVVVNRIKGRRQIKQNESTNVTLINRRNEIVVDARHRRFSRMVCAVG